MNRTRTLVERMRHTFWIPPAICIAAGLVLGLTLPGLDEHIALPDAIAVNGGADTARSLLQAIIGISVSVAGISFSVMVVALVLASQQLSPRVLRSFQRSALNQLSLGAFLGTATYAICVLSGVNEDPSDPVPEFSTSLAMLLAAGSLVLFVVFLHHLLRSLNASSVIRRIAAEGQRAVEHPDPHAVGGDPEDAAAAAEAFEGKLAQLASHTVRAPRAGYLAGFEAAEVLALAREENMFIAQALPVGDFAITGGTLATVWSEQALSSSALEEVASHFVLSEERVVDHDVALPIRQLADVALKGLSPGINDPSTSENAMNSVTDSLVRASRQGWGSAVRLDSEGTPRLRMTRPSFDRLVEVGFDQVRRDAANRPSFAVRLLELLAALRELGGPAAAQSAEIGRQARLVCEQAALLADIEADRVLIEEAFSRLHPHA